MHGTGDTFLYVLAEKLHKTVAEIRSLTHRELVHWRAYLDVQDNLRELMVRTAEHRR